MSRFFVEVKGLGKYFPVQTSLVERLLTRRVDYVRAVDGISFQIKEGEVFTLAGESGSGKTTTARLLVGLEEPTQGDIIFDGADMFGLDDEERRRIKRDIQIIFQDPYASLNPRMRVGDAVGHPLEIHRLADGEEKKELVLRILERVGLTPPEAFYSLYPHELSGGQRQRVAIARALVLKPRFVVADEPVSMIDVSLRALILDLMMELKKEFNLTYLFITHDLAVARYISDTIAIMYLGEMVEKGPTRKIFSRPAHPYTQALISAIPVPDPREAMETTGVTGEIPDPVNPPSGCRFHPRCPYAFDRCPEEEPGFTDLGEGHVAACHLLD